MLELRASRSRVFAAAIAVLALALLGDSARGDEQSDSAGAGTHLAGDGGWRLRFPLAALAGPDTAFGTGALTLGVETAGGWGAGLGFGLSDARPGTLHSHYGLFLRAPVFRAGPFELGAMTVLARGNRERERHFVNLDPAGGRLLRWLWRPSYRADIVASARWRRGPWALRLDGGIGVVLNEPRCEFSSALTETVAGSCADPRIPTEYLATRVPGKVAPFVAVAAEYDLAPAVAPGPTEKPAPSGPVRPDARETNGWITPTALTLPAGDVRVTAYELLFTELAYGVSDAVQVSAGIGYVPPGGGLDLLWRAETKIGLRRTGRVRLALLGSIQGYAGEYDTDGTYGAAGGAISVCLDQACQSLASAAVHGFVGWEDPDEGDSSWTRGVLLSANLVVALGPHLKLVGEIPAVWPGELMGFVLLRLPFRHFGLEVGTVVGYEHLFPVGGVSWRF